MPPAQPKLMWKWLNHMAEIEGVNPANMMKTIKTDREGLLSDMRVAIDSMSDRTQNSINFIDAKSLKKMYPDKAIESEVNPVFATEFSRVPEARGKIAVPYSYIREYGVPGLKHEQRHIDQDAMVTTTSNMILPDGRKFTQDIPLLDVLDPGRPKIFEEKLPSRIANYGENYKFPVSTPPNFRIGTSSSQVKDMHNLGNKSWWEENLYAGKVTPDEVDAMLSEGALLKKMGKLGVGDQYTEEIRRIFNKLPAQIQKHYLDTLGVAGVAAPSIGAFQPETKNR